MGATDSASAAGFVAGMARSYGKPMGDIGKTPLPL
jgi:hypothetical protein